MEYWVYMPGGKRSCDYWFIKEEDTYHAYYLEFQSHEGYIEDQSIAHLTSTDFKNWEYHGTVLEGFVEGGWPDRHLATGSVVKHDGRYYMMYTGHTENENRLGMGMAVSDDLYHWERIGEGPQIPATVDYDATYKGEAHSCRILADPYMYPEAIDGWYYAYINSWTMDLPKNERGCQLMFRSKDLINWESYKIAIIVEDLDRLETCQVWEHNGKWYMYFGGQRVKPDGGEFENIFTRNYIFMADSFEGPYERQHWSEILLDIDKYYYIFKQMKDPNGVEVGTFMSPLDGLLEPFKLEYDADGRVRFEKYEW